MLLSKFRPGFCNSTGVLVVSICLSGFISQLFSSKQLSKHSPKVVNGAGGFCSSPSIAEVIICGYQLDQCDIVSLSGSASQASYLGGLRVSTLTVNLFIALSNGVSQSCEPCADMFVCIFSS